MFILLILLINYLIIQALMPLSMILAVIMSAWATVGMTVLWILITHRTILPTNRPKPPIRA